MPASSKSLDSPPQDPVRWLDCHGDALFRYALLRVRQVPVAEDLVQETLVAALEARERFAGASSERTWLVSILRHKIMNHLRRERSRAPATRADDAPDRFFDSRGLWKEPPARWSADPRALAEQNEFWTVLRQCLSRLPRRLAEPFCLREIDDLSSGEVCDVLGIKPGTLWTQIHRARLLLRKCLEVRWFASPGSPET